MFMFNMDRAISKCQTITELEVLERQNTLDEREKRLVHERKLGIYVRISNWRLENERLGLVSDFTDTWTPEQRERFLSGWQNDDVIVHAACGEKRSYVDDDEPQSGRGQDGFSVEKGGEVNVKKFRAKGMRYHINFTNVFADTELSQYHDRLHEIFQSLLDSVIGDVPPQDQVRFVLQSPQLEAPISFPFMPRQRLTTERVLAEFERVLQSNRDFHLNDSVSVDVTLVEMPHGGKGTKRAEINLEKHLAGKRSIVRIQNRDELCLARALVVARAKIDKDSRDRQIRRSDRPLQARMARELHQKACVPIGPCGIEEVKQFQVYLSEYQINIVSKEYGDKIIYTGPEKEEKIYLYLHDKHYDVITTMPGFLARAYYCHTCKKGYSNREKHLCPGACQCCRFPGDCPIVSWIHCDECNRMFKSQACFDRHEQPNGNAKSVCAMLVKCSECHKVFSRYESDLEKHHCGMTKCPVCGEYVRTDDHQCYMQPVRETDGVTENGYDQLLFFDFECRQENGNHEPNLCIVQNETGDEWVFEGDTTRNEFCEWLFQKERANSVVMAHNF
jgi:hypothetical protein